MRAPSRHEPLASEIVMTLVAYKWYDRLCDRSAKHYRLARRSRDALFPLPYVTFSLHCHMVVDIVTYQAEESFTRAHVNDEAIKSKACREKMSKTPLDKHVRRTGS